MLLFNPITKRITSTTGGYTSEGLHIRDTYVQLMSGLHIQRGILYEPVVPCEKSKIGVVIVHSDSDYSTWDMCGEMAKRGYRALGGQVTRPDSSLDGKMLDIRRAVDFLYPGVEKVVLMGHSGGATLMSAYQNVAENGVKVFRGEEKLIKCTIDGELSPADGLMALDANWGNGAMTLFSVDPAVIEEGNGIKLDPELDIFSPANGYDPLGAEYDDSFVTKFCSAQAKRNNAIVDKALERLHALENGKGFYADDEPFIITGAAQYGPCNKLFPQDIRLLSHTKEKHDLLHADGSVTNEIVRSVRRPMFLGKSQTPGIFATLQTTVRQFLSERAAIASRDYRINSDGVTGIDWTRSYDCPPANICGISVPVLCAGMTGGYEYLASEAIYENATSKDKALIFIDGADHNFKTCTGCEAFPGQFGDTQKTLFDYVDAWLDKRFVGGM